MNLDTITCADIFDLCATVPDGAVDMILCDLPYGTTACSWDTVIPFEPMWKAFKRIIKPRGAIVLTASQPFTSALVMSNPGMFRYEWVWQKIHANNFVRCNREPQKLHENILVFSERDTKYFPILSEGKPYKFNKTNPRLVKMRASGGKTKGVSGVNNGHRHPISIIRFPIGPKVHPTQKPVALFEYLIRTYTQPGELVFDPCCGSGTTAIAARRCERHFVCGDSSPEYVAIANERLQNTDPYQDRKVAPNVTQFSLFSQLEATGA